MKKKRKKSSKRRFEEKVGSVVIPIYRTRVQAKGRKYLAWTVAFTAEGRRQRIVRASLEEAREIANEKATQLANGHIAAMGFSSQDAASYGRACELIGPTGKPLEVAAGEYAEWVAAMRPTGVSPAVAVADYLRRHPVGTPDRTVPDLLKEMLVIKKADGASHRWLKDLENRLTRFAAAFAVPIRDVTASEITNWLRSLKNDERPLSGRTRNNYRNAISALYSFAEEQGFLPRDWPELSHVAKQENEEGEIGILSPDEMKKLLAGASERVVPYLVLGGFMGLRTGEIQRLDWKSVRWDSNVVVIGAEGRTPSRRLAPITDAARSWLAPLKKDSGRVLTIGSGLTNAITRLARRSKVKWKHNALRHSFISYRVAQIQNTAQVAEEAGNSPAIIHKHYRELVTKEQATAWFALRK